MFNNRERHLNFILMVDDSVPAANLKFEDQSLVVTDLTKFGDALRHPKKYAISNKGSTRGGK